MAGRLLIAAGLGLVLLGLVFPWLGHLPGDFRFGKGPARVYLPLGSCLAISLLLSVVLTAAGWLWRK
ncbi:MAG TPA: DUF2905 domain-containing protein [Acetobacteraceae bacterium]|nr:DUF2905 domain-containing protein [Acetobacteraceae bacterium]